MHEIHITESDHILIVAPHPDDECIGVGGLMSLYPRQCEVWVLTDGSMGGICGEKSIADIRERELKEELAYLNISRVRAFNLKDGSLTNNTSFLKNQNMSEYTKIFVPNQRDRHPDHIAAFCMVKEALCVQNNYSVDVYQYEVSAPLPNYTHVLDITKVIGKKQHAIEKLVSQIQQIDYVSLATSLNSYRACSLGYKKSFLEVFYQTNINEDMESETALLAQKYQKFKSYFMIYDKWIHSMIRGEKIEEKLLRYGMHTVAIYGYGRIGRTLVDALAGTRVSVRYVIDKVVDLNEEFRIPIVRPATSMEKVDGVIVTAMFDFDGIYHELHDVLKLPRVYSFVEMLESV